MPLLIDEHSVEKQNIVVVQKENCGSWSVWYLARPSSTVIGWLGKK